MQSPQPLTEITHISHGTCVASLWRSCEDRTVAMWSLCILGHSCTKSTQYLIFIVMALLMCKEKSSVRQRHLLTQSLTHCKAVTVRLPHDACIHINIHANLRLLCDFLFRNYRQKSQVLRIITLQPLCGACTIVQLPYDRAILIRCSYVLKIIYTYMQSSTKTFNAFAAWCAYETVWYCMEAAWKLSTNHAL